MHNLLLRVAAALVIPALLLTGCGDDDEPAAPEPTSSEPSAVDTDDPAAQLVESGLAQLQSGGVDAARGTFENALALDPKNLFALYNLGLIAQQAGDATTAASYYDQALIVDGAYTPALFNRAIIDESTDLDAAVAAYRKVVELDPEFAPAYVRLGFALIEQGDKTEGEELRQQGIELDPSLADVEAPTYAAG